MELNLDEITALKNGESLKQKIEEVISVLQEKGFKAKIQPSPFGEITYSKNTLYFSLSVSIPANQFESNKNSAPNRKKHKTFLQTFIETINFK